MRILSLGFLLAASVVGMRAQSAESPRMRLSAPDVRKEIVEVVSGQLAAFRTDNWEKAYSFSARSFQNVIPPDAFARMITRNYGVAWKNTRAEFGIPSDNGHLAVVPVRVFGQGRSEAYNWLLVKEGEAWRITGVVPQKTDSGA